MSDLKPIHIGDLLFEIDELLINLLYGLNQSDWSKQTIAPKWKIKDVAAHLLDGNLRSLSMLRDQYFGETPDNITSYQELVQFLDQLNADWIKSSKRLSPKVIVELLKVTGKEYCEHLSKLNPEDKAAFSVAWAGEEESKNWFHIAREYTEKWHHQQQIRLAIGDHETLLTDKYYVPYLDTSIRGLPHVYRDLKGNKGDLIKIVFQGNSDKVWFLQYENEWKLLTTTHDQANCEVVIPDNIAWQVFTKGIKKEKAIQQSKIHGKKEIGLKIFDLIAVMANA